MTFPLITIILTLLICCSGYLRTFAGSFQIAEPHLHIRYEVISQGKPRIIFYVLK